MKKYFGWYYKLQTYIMASLFALVVAVTFFQVVNRTLLKIPINWPEELARYLIVWLAFIASISAFRKGAMIGIDVITSKLHGRVKFIFNIFQNVVIVGFAAIVTFYAFNIIMMQIEVNQRSPALHLNMSIPYLALPVWGILTIVEMTAITVALIRDYKNDPGAN